MKRFIKLFTTSVAASVAVSTALLLTTTGLAHADCFQYTSNNLQTSKTPVFNNICGVPTLLSSTNGQYPLGDESNFVRIRPDTSGDVTSNATNPQLTNSLSAACNSGDKYDIWTYIHNDASQDYNNLDVNGNPVTPGTGSAVAHDVKLAMTAPTNTVNSTFHFGSVVSASNASSVADSTTLDCGGKQVKLTLVPGSVHYNNNLNQPNYNSIGDGSVNGTIPVGSPNFPGSGQTGTQLGCWDYRIEVVYQVSVQTIPTPPQVTATCDLFGLKASDNRKVIADQFKYTAINAEFKSLVVNWGDNTAQTVVTNPNSVINQVMHTFSANGTYTVIATVNFTSANGNISSISKSCEQQVTFTSNKPPVITPPTVTPPTTPTTPATPTSLVNTGPGSIAGLFAAATLAGTMAYRKMLGRRLS
jgi:hypothetical protein